MSVLRAVNRAALWSLLCLFSGSIASGQENYLVTDVSFRGNEAFSGGRLAEQVVAHGKSRFLGLFSRGEDFFYGEDALKSDVEHLTRFYQREGYLHAAVSFDPRQINNTHRTVAVTFHVREGSPVIVSQVRWTIKPANPDSASSERHLDSLLTGISKDFQVTIGTRFRDSAARADRELISHALADHGYPYAETKAHLQVDTAAMRVAVNWEIKPGPFSVFGDVTVMGNEGVSESSIKEQLAFETGDTFRQSLLTRSQERVYGLGVFRIVTVVAQLDSSHSQRVPVEVNVNRLPNLSTEFGFGYGREEEIRLHNHSRLLGFLGETRSLDLTIKHSALEPYHVELAWTKPAFLTPVTSIVLSPFVRRQTEPGYTLNRYGGNVKLIHQFSRYVDGSTVYEFERVELDKGSVSPDAQVAADLAKIYNKSSVAVGLTGDKAYPAFSPVRGVRGSVSLQASGLDLGSKYHFYKVLLDGRYYRQAGRFVLSTRVKWGGIKSIDKDRFVPVEERFYAGGSKSVRGWPRAELGPMRDGVPVGGNALLEGSVEIRHPVVWKISAAIFMDGGNVWEKTGNVSIGGIRYSAGFGFRYGTPIGPIRLDLARPVWDERKAWLVHLSVGEAF